MARIKILQIIPTLNGAGAERLVVDLAKFLDREKFAVAVICLKAGGAWTEELARAKIPVQIVNRGNYPIVFDFFRLVKIIKQAAPDIVHTHLFGADIYGRLAAKLAGVKKIISTEHNLNYSEGAGKRFLKKKTAILAAVIVAVSESVKKYLIEREGVPAGKIRVIYNGVDIEKFRYNERKYEQKSAGLVIGSIGRLEPQKDFPTLIKAMAEIKGAECRIIGAGGERKKLARLIAELSLADKVKLLGWQKDTSTFLKQTDIFVLPSRWEGFGIVILEAGLSGLPVIGSRVDGIAEIIADGQDGLLFEPGNSAELARKIKSLQADPALRERLGKNLQDKILEKFSIEKMVKQYEDLYFEVLSRK
ncbi:MAG TPA: glycosyltransferase [Candidatus Nanoarchaeia archaeon]|nr:glycosyltransferase [Candidatus Nanoarchaeia archaeon]